MNGNQPTYITFVNIRDNSLTKTNAVASKESFLYTWLFYKYDTKAKSHISSSRQNTLQILLIIIRDFY